MLIYFYLFALIVGGVLLGASMLLGGHEAADAGAGGGGDAGADTDTDGADHAGEVGGHGGVGGLLFTFVSLRFWTFFLAFFGLTGLTLDGLDLVGSEWLALAASLGMGLTTALGAVALIRKLGSDTTGSAVQSGEYVGKTARVLVPFEQGSTGKVRVQIKGNTIDLLATGVDEEQFTGKEEVLIVEMEGNRARVARVRES